VTDFFTTFATRGGSKEQDHFNLIRNHIKTQFEKVKSYMPKLKEFAVLVTDPEWVSEDVW
jgi:hypothetical protein